jgi:hypothetical protein
MNRMVILSLAEQWRRRWLVGRCRLRGCVAWVDAFRNVGACGRGSRLRHSLRAAYLDGQSCALRMVGVGVQCGPGPGRR